MRPAVRPAVRPVRRPEMMGTPRFILNPLAPVNYGPGVYPAVEDRLCPTEMDSTRPHDPKLAPLFTPGQIDQPCPSHRPSHP